MINRLNKAIGLLWSAAIDYTCVSECVKIKSVYH